MIPTPSTKTTIDNVASMFGLPSWDDVTESNWQNLADLRNHVFQYRIKEGDSEEEAEAKADKAEQDEDLCIYRKWYDAVIAAVTPSLEAHGLCLVDCYKDPTSGRSYNLKYTTSVNWIHTVYSIRKTVNGVGYFEFSSNKEMRTSGPYDGWRGTAMNHIGWVTSWWEVYGETSPKRAYERHFR